ncbi:HeH/LEM domain protein [compost metagenome]
METIKLTFTGDPAHPGEKRDDLVIGGHVFPLGKAVEVPDTPAFRKLAGNSHFNGGSPHQDEEGDHPRTVAELKEALEARGIEYPADAKKADLVALYEAA